MADTFDFIGALSMYHFFYQHENQLSLFYIYKYMKDTPYVKDNSLNL